MPISKARNRGRHPHGLLIARRVEPYDPPDLAPRPEPRRTLKIWIDADAAPRDVKDIVARAALRTELHCYLVANQRLQTPANNPFVEAVRVEGGPDVADDHIAEHAQEGDLAVTADIPLASRLVEKGVGVVDPRGTEYDRENIGERLSVRDFMDDLRSTGVETGGPSAFGVKEKQAFAATFDRVLTRLARKAARRAAKAAKTAAADRAAAADQADRRHDADPDDAPDA